MSPRGWVAVVVVLLGCAAGAWPSGAAAATDSAEFTQIGQLALPDAGEDLQATAISGDTAFAGAPDTTFQDVDQGAIFAYTEPAGGWAGAPAATATLVASDPQPEDNLGTVVDAAGSTVVTGSDQPATSGGEIRVFSEPADGWSGIVHQGATLITANVRLFSPTVSGSTIVALGQYAGGPGTPVADLQTYLYVFTEPTGGWSGLQGPSAVLTPPAEASISDSGESVAVGSGEIVAGSGAADTVFVFDEPSTGWSGTITPAATLTTGTVNTGDQIGWSVILDGSTVVAGEANPAAGRFGVAVGAWAFEEPAGGWSSESTAAAHLVDPQGPAMFDEPASYGTDLLARSGSMLLVPGQGVIDAYSIPTAGLSGTVDPTARLVSSGVDLTSVGVDGSTVFASAATPVGSPAEAPSDFHSSDQITLGPISADGLLLSDAATYVFPNAGQLTGTVTPAATLTPGASAATASREDIFSEPAGGWSSAGPSAVLTAPTPPATDVIGPVTSDGPDVTADWDISTGGPAVSTPLIFAPGTSGWSFDEATPAQLIEPSGWSVRTATAGDGAAAALAVGAQSNFHDPPSERIDLYTEPASGWTGAVSPSAYVAVPAGAYVANLWLSGKLLVTLVDGTSNETGNSIGDVYDVYTEPAGGWSAGLGTPATLNVSPAAYTDSGVSFTGDEIVVGGQAGGRTIAAGATAQVSVFMRPSGGWRGSLAPTAKLTVPYTGGWVFQEPAGGWRSSTHPVARMSAGTIAAVSGDGRTLTVTQAFSATAAAPTPEFAVLGEPAGGWRGVLTSTTPPSSELSYEPGAVAQLVGGDLLVAGSRETDPDATGTTVTYNPRTGQPEAVSDGQSLVDPTSADPAAAEQSAVDVYRIGTAPVAQVTIPDAPRLSVTHLSGTNTGRPSLRLTVTASKGANALSQVRLTLPTGLSFVRSVSRLRNAVLLCEVAGVVCTSPQTRELLITLRPDITRHTGLVIPVPAGAIRETATLKHSIDRAVAYNRLRAHRAKRSVTLKARAVTLDVLGATAARTMTFHIR